VESDIHIEPYEKEFRVRFRMDGCLRIMTPPMKMRDALTSGRDMARLDIAEKQLPQGGRIKIRVRLRTAPASWTSRCRPTDDFWREDGAPAADEKSQADMARWDSSRQPDKFKRISQPYGMVLVTGPTGSGKTSNALPRFRA
jgi:type IV pilus assembly protein PilB